MSGFADAYSINNFAFVLAYGYAVDGAPSNGGGVGGATVW